MWRMWLGIKCLNGGDPIFGPFPRIKVHPRFERALKKFNRIIKRANTERRRGPRLFRINRLPKGEQRDLYTQFSTQLFETFPFYDGVFKLHIYVKESERVPVELDYSGLEHMEEELSVEEAKAGKCPLCKRNFEQRKMALKLPDCGHLVHSTCLVDQMEWKKLKCPTCNKWMSAKTVVDYMAELDAVMPAGEYDDDVVELEELDVLNQFLVDFEQHHLHYHFG